MTTKKSQAITHSGAPCQAYALAGSDYCSHHDPARATERREARSKGGHARHGRHIGPVGQAEPVPLDTMTDVERVNLVLAAQERDDLTETQALEKHCRTIESLQQPDKLYLSFVSLPPHPTKLEDIA